MVENNRVDAKRSTKNRAMRVDKNLIQQPIVDIKLPYLYSTLSMSSETKKRLPVPRVKWLFVRAQSKDISSGRMDAEVTISDEHYELVALSDQVSFIVDTTTGAEKGQKSLDSRL